MDSNNPDRMISIPPVSTFNSEDKLLILSFIILGYTFIAENIK